MLYAILVEGAGPLGSVFNRDDFTDKEVRDTDGDGLPEFVDAWGQPLQFFRWPLLYHSDIQRGQAFVATAPQTWSLVPPYSGAARRSASRTPRRQPAARGARMVVDLGTGGLSANPDSPFTVAPALAVPPGSTSARRRSFSARSSTG